MILKIEEFLKDIFTNYRKLWQEQNRKISLMEYAHKKQINNYKKNIEVKDKDALCMHEQITSLQDELKIEKSKNQKLSQEKRKLASSKGGLNSKVKFQSKRITDLENKLKNSEREKQELRKIVSKISKADLHSTPEELRNYILYGNKGGKKRK